MADINGKDAYLVIDDDGACGFGHIGFLVEDKDGNWWHFYWGGRYPYISFILVLMEPETWFVPYDGELTLDSINDSGQYSGTYDRMLYFSGDFSDCVDDTNEMTGWYSLYGNNCSQVSTKNLSYGSEQFMVLFEEAADYLIPKMRLPIWKINYTVIIPIAEEQISQWHTWRLTKHGGEIEHEL